MNKCGTRMLLLILSMIITVRLSKKIFSYELYGNASELQYVFANIYVGTPPQQQSVIVDTGSSFVGIPCKKSCNGGCGSKHVNNLFMENISSTYLESSCEKHSMSSCNCQWGKCRYDQVIHFIYFN